MPNFCYVKIQASGSAKEVDQVKKLFDKHTKPCPVRDDLLTEFDKLVEKTDLKTSFGWRRHTPASADPLVVWEGLSQWGPPDEFVIELSKKFPDIKFSIYYFIEGFPNFTTFEIHNGRSDLMYETDGRYEYSRDNSTGPIDHYRVYLRFDSEANEQRVMKSLFDHKLLDVRLDQNDESTSQYEKDHVVEWINRRFPEVEWQVVWWVPFRAMDEEVGKSFIRQQEVFNTLAPRVDPAIRQVEVTISRDQAGSQSFSISESPRQGEDHSDS